MHNTRTSYLLRRLLCSLSAFSSLLLLATGCGVAVSHFPGDQAAPTVTIAASPTSVAAGGTSVLTVVATNADTVQVTGSDHSSYTLQTNGGTVSVTPSATTTYTAYAAGSGGSVTAKAIVTVFASAAPSVTITANPTSVAAGASSVLTVTATNATAVTITGTDNSSYTLPGTGGTQSVSPTQTTTYTATATGPGGNATATAQVTVTAASSAPTVTITAKPTSITSGSSSVLTATATNATSVTITGTDKSSYTLPGTGGTQSVSPTQTTTYTATATGAGGSATATVQVTVTANPAPTVTITANPDSITAGSSSTLTVKATNATSVTITGSDKSSYTLSQTGGIQSVSPAATTTYTATATGPGGSVSANVTLTVTPNPAPTVTITASPNPINSGSSTTLTVTASNATQVTITGDGNTYTLTATGGTQAVSPTTNTTYTATATGPGGTVTATVQVTVTPNPPPNVAISANPTTINSGGSSLLTVTASNASQVTVTGTDNSSYTLSTTGGTQSVSPTSTTTYTATATGPGGTATDSTTVTVQAPGNENAITHVIFMLQENHTFDNYFGMLNPYRHANNMYMGADGNDYEVDGIDDKLSTISNTNDEGQTFSLFKFKTACIDDETSDWLASYGQVNTYNFTATRPILMNGFVHSAEGYAKSCAAANACSGSFTDTAGQRAMGYYDQDFLNYYYYMASQFALSDRWFSPVSSKSISNRIATFSGGTTQGLVKDPGGDDHLKGSLGIETIFQELQNAGVSWKIYYISTQGFCLGEDDCASGGSSAYPATDFSEFTYSYNYLRGMPSSGGCPAPLQPSSVIDDSSNSFCIDPNHIAPLNDPKYGYFADLKNNTLPSFAFIEAGYGRNDEHPGSNHSVLAGQQQVAQIVNALMTSTSWQSSVFFLAYDEGGGPYDHVPPVPGHSNDYTDAMVGSEPVGNIPDISTIAVNPDSYNPCVPNPPGTATLHCDLSTSEPGANPADAAAQQGFAAQLGFRVPNMVISPFTKEHYVSHIPMDHTAIIKFVENRFIGPSAHLTNRDAAQPNLLDFFDFTNPPWMTPPTPPTPVAPSSSNCTPTDMGP